MIIREITLVACCGKKLGRRAAAEQLYRSPLFQKSAQWSRKQGNDWFVLSARYGLIKPDTPILPYNQTLGRMNRDDRRYWAQGVATQLDALLRFWGADQLAVTLLAGKHYAAWIPLVDDFCTIQQPMEGMQIGQRLHWLTSQLET